MSKVRAGGEEGIPQTVVTTQPHGPGSNDGLAHDKPLPDGLRQLSKCSEILIEQHLAGIDFLCCCNRPYRYSVYDTTDLENPILYIRESSDCFFRQCLGAARRVTLKITDDDHKLLARLHRPLTCSRGCCCCACSLPVLGVISYPGLGLAKITEKRTCLAPRYEIEDSAGNLKFRFKTDCVYSRTCQWFGDLAINIYDIKTDDVAAQIVKKTWKNFEEFLSFQNNIIVRFLADLNITERLMILGAVFMVDLHNYEDDRRLCC